MGRKDKDRKGSNKDTKHHSDKHRSDKHRSDKELKELLRLKDAAAMHSERYETYKTSHDEWLRRKVTCDLDRFLMEHRETAIILMAEGLEHVLSQMYGHAGGLRPSAAVSKTRTSWWRRRSTNTVRP